MVVLLGILLWNSLFGLMYAAAVAKRLVPKVAGVGSASGFGSCCVTMVLLASASASAIGLYWLSVVNWKMGTVVPLAGVILTGGSVGPAGLR